MLDQDCLNIRLSDYFEARRRETPEGAEGSLQEPEEAGSAQGGAEAEEGP